MSVQAFLEGDFSGSTIANETVGDGEIRIEVQPQVLLAPGSNSSEGEPLRHILLGSPGSVRQTIHLLHTLRYVENALWSPLVTIPENKLIITPRQGEVMSLLIRHMRER